MADDDAGQMDEIAARLAMLKARMGERFSAEETAHLRRDLARQLEQSERLRAVPLTNADEPAVVFVPYRAEEQPR